MKPSIPETPSLRELQNRSAEELAAEVKSAERFLQTAETYLAWVRLSQQLVEQLQELDSDVVAETPKPGGVTTGGIAPTEVVGTARNLGVHDGRPSLRRAVLMVMQTDPDKVWRKREIYAALKERGWLGRGQKPSAQLATRLSEMNERGEIVRVEYGYYALPTAESVVAQSALVTGDDSATAQVGADK